jgi:hypothetical protein
MATSDVSICNLALQKLGAARINTLAETGAKDVAACYEQQRDLEQRKYLWNFGKTRVQLAASSVAPAFTFANAFPVPANLLRIIKPARLGLDWQLEQHEGVLAILTNDSAPLDVRYFAKVTNPALFDPCFVEMLACKIAWHCCERVTQSNSKKAALMEEYKEHKAEARKTNAFELPTQEEPEDEWVVAREGGSRNWLRFGDL